VSVLRQVINQHSEFVEKAVSHLAENDQNNYAKIEMDS